MDKVTYYLDEVGRGCCAGNVVACAVILFKPWAPAKLKDSKKMTAKARAEILVEMKARQTCGLLDFRIGEATPEEIDSINILQATYLAMHRALNAIRIDHGPGHLVVDGNIFQSPYDKDCTYECIVGGDATVSGISAASVAAKVYRDECMNKLHLDLPQYGWCNNKGYVTKDHLKAIKEHGYTKYHRRSYDLKL